MQRPVLPLANIHSAIQNFVATNRQKFVKEVQTAIAVHPVVVVGMGINPMPKKARKLLDAAGIAHHDMDYGSYFSMWRDRNALKMWTGWPTFPMVFVRGTLVGGASDVQKLLASGELQKMLTSGELQTMLTSGELQTMPAA
ncbi:MAG: glutaredoxin domain-containing protein [Cytophagales bacterium]|nr:glutaredoxin domain-containing protein [Cytophagales bacterium]